MWSAALFPTLDADFRPWEPMPVARRPLSPSTESLSGSDAGSESSADEDAVLWVPQPIARPPASPAVTPPATPPRRRSSPPAVRRTAAVPAPAPAPTRAAPPAALAPGVSLLHKTSTADPLLRRLLVGADGRRERRGLREAFVAMNGSLTVVHSPLRPDKAEVHLRRPPASGRFVLSGFGELEICEDTSAAASRNSCELLLRGRGDDGRGVLVGLAAPTPGGASQLELVDDQRMRQRLPLLLLRLDPEAGVAALAIADLDIVWRLDTPADESAPSLLLDGQPLEAMEESDGESGGEEEEESDEEDEEEDRSRQPLLSVGHFEAAFQGLQGVLPEATLSGTYAFRDGDCMPAGDDDDILKIVLGPSRRLFALELPLPAAGGQSTSCLLLADDAGMVGLGSHVTGRDGIAGWLVKEMRPGAPTPTATSFYLASQQVEAPGCPVQAFQRLRTSENYERRNWCVAFERVAAGAASAAGHADEGWVTVGGAGPSAAQPAPPGHGHLHGQAAAGRGDGSAAELLRRMVSRLPVNPERTLCADAH